MVNKGMDALGYKLFNCGYFSFGFDGEVCEDKTQKEEDLVEKTNRVHLAVYLSAVD